MMIDLFPIPLLNHKININCEALAEQILEMRKKKEGKPHMDYTSYFEKGNEMAGVEWDALRDEIVRATNALNASVNMDVVIDSSHVHAWWNVYEGQHHCWHSHGRALWAGTFYVQMDETMQPIKFRSPIQGLVESWSPVDSAFRDTRWVQERTFFPEPGTILMWPSWMEHTVPELFNKVPDKPRITISFNIAFKR